MVESAAKEATCTWGCAAGEAASMEAEGSKEEETTGSLASGMSGGAGDPVGPSDAQADLIGKREPVLEAAARVTSGSVGGSIEHGDTQISPANKQEVELELSCNPGFSLAQAHQDLTAQ